MEMIPTYQAYEKELGEVVGSSHLRKWRGITILKEALVRRDIWLKSVACPAVLVIQQRYEIPYRRIPQATWHRLNTLWESTVPIKEDRFVVRDGNPQALVLFLPSGLCLTIKALPSISFVHGGWLR